ncbi:hypothetical protein D9756_001903 [Leucocoprinus leucothites]|uniref:RlpA-like double-psi beta-barrel-protein domain-containing protein-containing protein n=1 Tax=Leucocoprinus leucothites TaxID=201217 RepID=A0A8H5G580_9AGAR|nr:hypothetical protein D9756_001903 [Leucoagaricus leucothites]
MKLITSMWLFALGLPFIGVPTEGHSIHGHQARSHQSIARRAGGDMQTWKRFSSSRWTFYDVGLGACGKHNVPSDFIVALNSAQFGGGYPGPHCFEFITMTYKGKTARAQIMDECPGCPYGGLDLSEGLFKHFDSLDLGVLSGSWTFGGGGGGGDDDEDEDEDEDEPKTTKKPATTHHTTKTTTKATPTPTYEPDSETSSSSSSTQSTSKSSSTTSSNTLVINYSAGISSGLAVPTATGIADAQSGNINNFNKILVGLGSVVVAAARAG